MRFREVSPHIVHRFFKATIRGFPKVEDPNKSTLNRSILTKRDLKARYPFIFGYSRKSAWRLEAVGLRGVPGSKLREGSFP